MPDDRRGIPIASAADGGPAGARHFSAGTPSRTTGFLRQYELTEKIRSYHPNVDEDALNRAYVYAVQKHGSQTRASGDPYYAHPVAVAGLLADLRLDENTIIAGLLHDTVEDTDASLGEIADLFGEEVVELVDGVTKLTQLEYRSEESKQAENFQKFILATIQDIRVLLVKLADRLHNMRTLHFLKKPEKRERIARETLDIFGPLARRVGLSVYASEMEDLAFAEVYPDARKAIQHRLDEMEKQSARDLDRIRDVLTEMVSGAGIEARVVGRRKSPYSIWRKLERKNMSFSQITDLFAFRVIVDDVAECYDTLGLVHTHWACVPEKFKDYISVPKPNGYRSVHTTVNASGNRRVEVQIRTEEMHDIAERGVAAHWRYKNESYGFDADAAREGGIDTRFSLNTFAELMEDEVNPVEYLESAKLEMYRDSVFVFTPRGRLIALPSGAMPLDFAYSVHSRIGDTTTGVRINGEQRPLRTELQNGDVVEIVRGNDPAPVPGGEAMAITPRAKAAQRRLIKGREVQSYRYIGKGLVGRALRASGFDPVEVDLSAAVSALNRASLDAVYEDVGRERLDVDAVLSAAFPGRELDRSAIQRLRTIDDKVMSLMISGEDLAPGTAIHLESCCSPVPGDRIVGIRVKDRGLSVHAVDCPCLAQYDDRPDRWVDLGWTELSARGVVAQARIVVTAIHKRGVLATLCSAVAEANGNITAVETGRRSHDYIDLTFTIEIEDVKRLNQILAALRSLAVVDRAERLREENACP